MMKLRLSTDICLYSEEMCQNRLYILLFLSSKISSVHKTKKGKMKKEAKREGKEKIEREMKRGKIKVTKRDR